MLGYNIAAIWISPEPLRTTPDGILFVAYAAYNNEPNNESNSRQVMT